MVGRMYSLHHAGGRYSGVVPAALGALLPHPGWAHRSADERAARRRFRRGLGGLSVGGRLPAREGRVELAELERRAAAGGGHGAAAADAGQLQHEVGLARVRRSSPGPPG